MKTERHGWGTVYYSDNGERCATVELAHGAHLVTTFNVSHEGVLFQVVCSEPADELGAHAVAVAWVNPAS